jgi:C-terminal processing protease CtpA/Prc
MSCGPIETIAMADIAELEPGKPLDPVACDNRPLRHVPGAPANHAAGFGEVFVGLLQESNPSEAIYGAEWESLYTNNGSDGVGAALKDAVELFETSANGVILDHRTGTGGTILAPAILWNFAVPRRPLTFFQTRQRAEDEQPSLAEGLALFEAGLDDGGVDFAGGFAPTSMPVALLITEDVSASDWLPLGLKDAAPNVRIFGPFQTNGGFSTRYQLSYWLGLSFVMASGDSFVADGTSLNGTGVEPDEVVLPRQSDLLSGVDSVFEAALDWVRSEVTP